MVCHPTSVHLNSVHKNTTINDSKGVQHIARECAMLMIEIRLYIYEKLGNYILNFCGHLPHPTSKDNIAQFMFVVLMYSHDF